MPEFVIERDIPGAGQMTEEQIRDVSIRSLEVLRGIGPQIQWMHSYVTDDQANIEWTRNAWRDLRQFSTGGTYVNFLTEEEGDDRTRAAYRTNYARLAELKATWDPGNLFRTNKNIGGNTAQRATV